MRLNTRSIFCVTLATIFVVFAGSVAFAKPEMVLKFAGQSAVDHPATKQMNAIAEEIKARTDGRIEVKVYPASQLGDYTLVYEEQIKGTIDMSCISVPSQFDPRMELIYVNGFVSNYEDAKKVFSPSGFIFKKMNEYNERLGVKLLGFYVEGMIGIGTTKSVKEPLDPKVDKGVMVRIPGMDVYRTAAEAMGFKTASIPYAETYQAIQTGAADGVDGYPVAAAYTILGDVIKHWYMTNYSIEVLNLMISQKTWAKIKPEDQKVISQIMADATTKSVEAAEEVDKYYMDMMTKKGIKVHTYTKEELTPLMEAIIASWPKLEKNMTKELMDEFRAAFAK